MRKTSIRFVEPPCRDFTNNCYNGSFLWNGKFPV